MVADQTIPPWCAGEEVYGRSAALRAYCEHNNVGYVLRVGCAFYVELAPGTRLRTDAAVTQSARAWQVCSVAGSQGERALRLGLAGHHQPQPPPPHPPTPDHRRAGLPLLLHHTRTHSHPHDARAGGLPALAGGGGLVRHEALGRIPNVVGRNSEGGSWV
jgi:hypothetical protein